MNVTQQNIDALNAVLKVRIEKADYFENYENALKEQRRNATVPGFRPGKVPMGIIKKKVGTALLLDEVNNILSKSVQEHIEQNKLQVLGDPLPKRAEEDMDWNEPESLEFEFELGLAPDFDLKLSNKDKIKYYTIKVDDKLLNNQIDDLKRRYGKMEEADLSEDKDMVFGDLIELDEEGNIKEGGLMNAATISLEFIEDEATRKSLVGKKKKDEVVVDPRKVSKGDSDMATMLGIEESQVGEVQSNFLFRVEDIKRMFPAALDQEFFDKMFGKDTVTDENGFREKVREDLQKMFLNDSDKLLKRDISVHLLDKTKMKLPDEFLKRWLRERNEEGLSAEQIEKDYENYSKSLKWQLIENKLIRDNGIEVTPEEGMEHTKQMMVNQYAQYGIPAPDGEALEQSARKVLADQNEAKKIYEGLFDTKLMAFYKDTVKMVPKEVSYDEFVKLAQSA